MKINGNICGFRWHQDYKFHFYYYLLWRLKQIKIFDYDKKCGNFFSWIELQEFSLI